MTTSEQQAVPVAQVLPIDDVAALSYLAEPVQDNCQLAYAFARHRLAPLPCKSGEGACSMCDDAGMNPCCVRCGQPSAALTPDATQTREAEGGLAAFGAAMFQRIWDSFTDDGWDIEINDLVTVEAVKAGLVSVTPYDPEVHSDGSGAAEPGDDFYEVTPAGRAALNARGDA